MKRVCRLIVVCLLVFNLLATATPGLAIQPVSGPSADPQPSANIDIHLPYTVRVNASAGQTTAHAVNGQRTAAAAAAVEAQAAPNPLSLGTPGMSFRFGQMFGTENVFYTDDTAHLYHPNGLFAAADGVWVTEERGFRALKYDLSGTAVAQIGTAGHRYMTLPDFNLSLENLSDAAVDAAGNLWVVNSGPGTVVIFAPDGSYLGMVGREYNSGQAYQQFNNPMGVAFDSAGRLYVSDQWNQRVQVYDVSDPQNPQYLTTIGETNVSGDDNSHFSGPARIAIDASDRLYVVDAENQRVQILNVSDPNNPVYVGTLGTTGVVGAGDNEFCNPQGVAVSSTRIFVADNCNHRVQVFDRTSLALVGTIGTTEETGTDNNHLFEPQDVAVDANGLVYVADRGNDRVQIFTGGLAYSRRLGVTGVPYLTDKYHYNRPRGVAVDASGNIYFAEDAGQRLFKLSPTGSVVWSIGEAGVGLENWLSDTNHFYDPQDVAISPKDGNIYVANSRNNGIRIYNPSGVYQKTIGTGWGSGQLEFGWINGIGFGSDGTLYVADGEFHIVKIYNANGTYRTQMGVSGECGFDDTHFCNPRDVAVDSKGNIYVSEDGMGQVRMFDKNLALVRTLGVPGQNSDDYGYLAGPSFLAIDRSDTIYIGSSWDHTINVYDANGGFLAALGGWGETPSNLANVAGLAIGPNGSLYAADYDHARVVRYDRGYPNWRQININGFGYRWNGQPNQTAVYKDHYYVSSYGLPTLQAVDTNDIWTTVDPGSWGSAAQNTVISVYPYGDYLYVAAWTGDPIPDTGNSTCAGVTLKRFDGTTWEDVVTGGLNGDPQVCEIDYMQGFNGALYAFAYYFDLTSSTGYWQVWSSPTGVTWTKLADLDVLGTETIQAVTAHNGALYIATIDDFGNGRVWRSTDGATWNPVSDMKFGNTGEGYSPISLGTFNGSLYVGVRNFLGTGAQLWRCQVCEQQSDWTEVISNGIDGEDVDKDGTVDNYRIEAFSEHKGLLYAGVGNTVTGMQVWRSADGENWQRVAANGFGYGDTRASYGQGSGVLNGKLIFAATNYNLGMQVWEYNSHFIYLPTVRN